MGYRPRGNYKQNRNNWSTGNNKNNYNNKNYYRQNQDTTNINNNNNNNVNKILNFNTTIVKECTILYSLKHHLDNCIQKNFFTNTINRMVDNINISGGPLPEEITKELKNNFFTAANNSLETLTDVIKDRIKNVEMGLQAYKNLYHNTTNILNLIHKVLFNRYKMKFKPQIWMNLRDNLHILFYNPNPADTGKRENLILTTTASPTLPMDTGNQQNTTESNPNQVEMNPNQGEFKEKILNTINLEVEKKLQKFEKTVDNKITILDKKIEGFQTEQGQHTQKLDQITNLILNLSKQQAEKPSSPSSLTTNNNNNNINNNNNNNNNNSKKIIRQYHTIHNNQDKQTTNVIEKFRVSQQEKIRKIIDEDGIDEDEEEEDDIIDETPNDNSIGYKTDDEEDDSVFQMDTTTSQKNKRHLSGTNSGREKEKKSKTANKRDKSREKDPDYDPSE